MQVTAGGTGFYDRNPILGVGWEVSRGFCREWRGTAGAEKEMERKTRFELATSSLARRRSSH